MTDYAGSRIDHVGIAVSEAGRSRAFYERALASLDDRATAGAF